MKLFDWLFKKEEYVVAPAQPESVKPSDEVIELILSDKPGIPIPIVAQHVNWAAEQIGEEAKYVCSSPITPKSVWVLYEGCRVYNQTRGTQ